MKHSRRSTGKAFQEQVSLSDYSTSLRFCQEGDNFLWRRRIKYAILLPVMKMTKDAILELLRQHADTYVSGAELAKTLSVSRTAVWKGIEQLREEGYEIDSVTNKGYRLSSASDVLREEDVRKYLAVEGLDVRVYRSITSTNTVLKTMAEEGAPEGRCLIAGEQTAGRGRRGRSFYSPPDSGIYLSILLRPALQAADATSITACAAVAVAEAIESLATVNAEIKWVNDIYIDGKKVCGILTEASLDCESGQVNYLIVGIGINTRVPTSDFPEDLRSIAGSAFGEKPIPELRCRLAAGVLNRLMYYYGSLTDKAWFDEYRRRSLVLGMEINILAAGKEPEPAVALDLDRDFALVVRTESGELRRLNSGEVSVRQRTE